MLSKKIKNKNSFLNHSGVICTSCNLDKCFHTICKQRMSQLTFGIKFTQPELVVYLRWTDVVRKTNNFKIDFNKMNQLILSVSFIFLTIFLCHVNAGQLEVMLLMVLNVRKT